MLYRNISPEEIYTCPQNRIFTRAAGFRPDRLLAGAAQFVGHVFGEQFLHQTEADLAQVVEKESNCTIPLILCSTPGFDASWRVESLAAQLNKPYKVRSPSGNWLFFSPLDFFL